MNYSKLFTLVFILLMISCSEKNDVSEIDTLRSEIQQSDEFVAYQESLDNFFTQIRNQEYDFFTVYYFIHRGNITFDCSMDMPAEVLSLDGGSIYWNSRCEYESKLKEVHTMYPVLSTLDKNELRYLLVTKQSTASTRTNCLTQFQNEWNSDGSIYDSECDCWDVNDDYEDDVVSNYDDCCDGGGSGCP